MNIYFLSIDKSAVAVKCLKDENCQCFNKNGRGRYIIICSSDLEMSIDVAKKVTIVCNTTNLNWPNYFLDLSFEIGNITNLSFTNCSAPSAMQNASRNIKSVLGIGKVSELEFTSVQDQLSNNELEPYPSLRKLHIAKSDVRNLGKEFLSCKLKSNAVELLILKTFIYYDKIIIYF